MLYALLLFVLACTLSNDRIDSFSMVQSLNYQVHNVYDNYKQLFKTLLSRNSAYLDGTAMLWVHFLRLPFGTHTLPMMMMIVGLLLEFTAQAHRFSIELLSEGDHTAPADSSETAPPQNKHHMPELCTRLGPMIATLHQTASAVQTDGAPRVAQAVYEWAVAVIDLALPFAKRQRSSSHLSLVSSLTNSIGLDQIRGMPWYFEAAS